MISKLLCLLALVFAANPLAAVNFSPVRLDALTCEHLENPIGIGVSQPRLSWKLDSTRQEEIQTAYEICAASSTASLDSGHADLWNSGKIKSDQSVLVPWAGQPLASRSQVFWQVRVWDKDGQPSAWSGTASFELGLLNSATEWKGHWIAANLPRLDVLKPALEKSSWITAGPGATQPPAARLMIDLPAGVGIRNASADVVAEGLVTLYVNGTANQPGSSSVAGPLHAEFRNQLVPGKNIMGLTSTPARNSRAIASNPIARNAIAAHGIIELENGKQIEFNTDGSWKIAANPGGDWFNAAFDDSAWSNATVSGAYASSAAMVNNTVGAVSYLRKTFAVEKPIAKARLYATALGVYEASINGHRVSDTCLDPGWTDYFKRAMVQTYDVTKLLAPGSNAVGATLSDGWYAGRLGWMGLAQYGPHSAFNAQLEITYADGSTDTIVSDDSWKAGPGEILGSDQQWGEIIDARKAALDWCEPSFNAAAWSNVTPEEHNVALVPQLGPPIRKLMELTPQKISRQGSVWIVDFGQNMVGHVRLSARGPAGTVITLRHAEMLNTDGSLYTANLRPALATDKFILKGDSGPEIFEPHFTFHGFRYVEITGYPGELAAGDLRGIVVGSDTPTIGTFECSDTNLNRLYENIVWGQRGNFLSVPTDCPQRDERMGWMGDAQVFAPTAARNADVAGFFAKWLVDVDDGQSPKGDFSDVSPRVDRPAPGWPVWGDAGVIIPWVMYTSYGDKMFLADNYSNMVRWVNYNVSRSSNLILSGGVGDHLAPSLTPVNIVDTAYFANSARILAKSAAILGKTEDAAKYDQLSHDITSAFDKTFVGDDGSITATGSGVFGRAGLGTNASSSRFGNTQTAYILALKFDLLPESLRPIVAQRLAQDVEQNGHLTTGFVGVGLICPTLTQIGRSDLAWQLVFTDTYPSWLFSVKNGATTIWERWDGWTPEHGFQAASMNSFNHYSLGSVGAWLYTGAAGIQLDESSPGYKHFFLRPQFTTRLDYVSASLDSPYGKISSRWHVAGNQMVYDVTVPPNTSASLTLPSSAQNVRQSLSANNATNTDLVLPAGTYHFSFARKLIQ